jgi:putative ABC transport system permease protein
VTDAARGADPLWSKAPLLLLRFPRLLLTLWVGALLLTLAAAGYPLMLSARTGRLLHERIADPAVTRFGAGLTYATTAEGAPLRGSVPPRVSPEEIGRAFDERSADPSLGPVLRTELGPVLALAADDGSLAEGRLFAGDGAFDHVTVLQEAEGDGAWLPELTARALGVGRGDEITIGGRGDRSVRVRVAAIYRARVGEPRTGYWQAWDQQIYPTCTNECPVPPPFVLVTPEAMRDLSSRLGIAIASRAWQAPVAGDLTLDDARRLATVAERLQADAGRPGASLPCCRPFLTDGTIVTPRLASGMPAILKRAEGEVAGLAGPGRLLQVTAIAVALAVVGAAAALAHVARRTEFRLLFSRGVATATVAGRAALEAALPSLAGGVAGLAAGFALVPLFGAGARASGAAVAEALVAASIAVVGSVAVVAAVSAMAYARHGETHRGRIALVRRIPWELAVAGLAVAAFVRLRESGAFVEDAGSGVRVPSLGVLLFPVLTIGALVTLVARISIASAARLRERTDRSPPWLFLAVRRLVADAGSSILFVAAAALCLGIFVLAQTVVGSLRDTVDAKAELFVGSDVQGSILYDAPPVGDVGLPLTRVTRVPDIGTLDPGGAQVDLLAVDPATLASAAYWHDGLSSTSLERIAQLLARSDASSLPVAIAGNGDAPVEALDIGGTGVPVRVIATASAFPGISSTRPLVVVSKDAFVRVFSEPPNPLRGAGATTQLWVRGDTARAVAALRALRYQPYAILTADEARDIPHITIVLDTFAVLELLGSLAAVLVVASVLMYLQTRQRAQLVSYGLSLRMGLSDRRQRRSVVAEVAGVLGVAFLAGTAIAIGVSAVLLPLLDPLPAIPPEPFLETPVARFAVLLVGLVAWAWVAAWAANRTARAADLGGVMRGVE